MTRRFARWPLDVQVDVQRSDFEPKNKGLALTEVPLVQALRGKATRFKLAETPNRDFSMLGSAGVSQRSSGARSSRTGWGESEVDPTQQTLRIGRDRSATWLAGFLGRSFNPSTRGKMHRGQPRRNRLRPLLLHSRVIRIPSLLSRQQMRVAAFRAADCMHAGQAVFARGARATQQSPLSPISGDQPPSDRKGHKDSRRPKE